ncbi:MAG: helix-hairpin-helix domain-containing protein [Haloplanus sp.]
MDVTDDGVTVAREDTPRWVSPRPLFAGVAVDRAVDVALDGCGNRFLLSSAGDVYRQHVGEERVDELGCLWRPGEDPRAIAVTAETIYVAWGEPASVQVFSRTQGTTRRFLEVSDPVAFSRLGDQVCLLDRGERRGAGTVYGLQAGTPDRTLVTGLYDPRDIAVDDVGTLSVLDRQVRDDPDAPERYLVRTFDSGTYADGPVSAVDAVRVGPYGFQVGDTEERFVPSAIAVAGDGHLVAGVSPDASGERTLFRYRPTEAAFERQSAYRRGCVALSAPTGTDELIAIDGDGGVTALEPVYDTVRDGEEGHVGHLVTRHDAGEFETQWHRVSLDVDPGGPGTQVRLHYRATDDDQPVAPDPDPRESVAVAAIDGIGPRYARRLRAAGIETVADLLAHEPTAVAAILGVEEVSVPVTRAEEWLAETESLLEASDAGDEPPDLEAIDGIGPTYATRMRDAGVDDLPALVSFDAEAVADLATGELLDVSSTRVETWQAAGASMVPADPALHEQDWETVTPANPTEVLLPDAEGRYLWIDVELAATVGDAPTVSTVTAEAPRQSYLAELPAIYREDEASATFLEQYLALFESVFTDVEDGIADLTRYLDADGIPDHLAWLGIWLATETGEHWPEGARRAFIEHAPELYRARGTRAGLQAAIDLYLAYADVDLVDWASWERAMARERDWLDGLVDDGVLTESEADAIVGRYDDIVDGDDGPLVEIVEAHDLACGDEGPTQVAYSRLLSCEVGFLVLLDPALSDADVAAIERIVAHHEPAHASGQAVDLDHRAVLAGTDEADGRGYHTYLGINATLPEPRFELSAAGLGQETVLGEREPYGEFDYSARLGTDAHIS